MEDFENENFSEHFRWTPGKIMLLEATILMLGIIALVPVAFTGIGL